VIFTLAIYFSLSLGRFYFAVIQIRDIITTYISKIGSENG